MDNCGRFWFEPKNERNTVKRYEDEMNNSSSDLEHFSSTREISIDQILAAAYYKDGLNSRKFLRAKCIEKFPATAKSDAKFRVKLKSFKV